MCLGAWGAVQPFLFSAASALQPTRHRWGFFLRLMPQTQNAASHNTTTLVSSFVPSLFTHRIKPVKETISNEEGYFEIEAQPRLLVWEEAIPVSTPICLKTCDRPFGTKHETSST
jgi:hypothetical protein